MKKLSTITLLLSVFLSTVSHAELRREQFVRCIFSHAQEKARLLYYAQRNITKYQKMADEAKRRHESQNSVAEWIDEYTGEKILKWHPNRPAFEYSTDYQRYLSLIDTRHTFYAIAAGLKFELLDQDRLKAEIEIMSQELAVLKYRKQFHYKSFECANELAQFLNYAEEDEPTQLQNFLDALRPNMGDQYMSSTAG